MARVGKTNRSEVFTMKVKLTCLSVNCPERFSVCCKARSMAVSGGEGTGYYACSACGKEYIGGKCTAKSFFDYSTKEKKRIVKKAAQESNRAQKEVSLPKNWGKMV